MIDYKGQTLDGKYLIGELLGEGGMGRVYRGEHALIGRPVAVKFLHAELTGNEEVVRRFYREAQSAAAIRHKNVIDVLDVGVSSEGEPYLVLEFLEGEPLSEMIARIGAFDLPTACGILEPALLALQAAHERGIVHRDLKPDNIFLAHQPGEPPTIKLIDFGISKINEATGRTKLTQDGSLLGTPEYMSPEQARGAADLDHRADLYSMGVILYELLTGGRPFVGANYNELLIAVLTEEPRPPHEVNPDFPDEAAAVIGPALARDPADRFQSAAEMLDALRRLPGYAKRQDSLTMLGPRPGTRGVAAGDLGKPATSGRTGVAESVLDQVLRERAPGPLAKLEGRVVDLVGRIPKADRAVDRLGGGRRGTRRLLAIAGGALLAILLALILIFGGGDEPAPAPPESTVTITVRGAAANAEIYWDGYLVTRNPFKVERGEALVPLRVESRGRKPFKVSITPNEDQIVDVKAKGVVPGSAASGPAEPAPEPAAKSESAPAAGASPAEPGEKPAPAAEQDAAQKKGKRESKFKKFWKGLTN
jgi:tRNA A-37 threonylcarbamoyl transferase component Bud32